MKHYVTATIICGLVLVLPLALAGTPAAAAEPNPQIQAIANATDPSAAVAAYAAGFENGKNNLALHEAYVTKMVDFGLPEMAYHQARAVVTIDARNGLSWGVIAYVDARRGDMPEAFSAIVAAASNLGTNEFVQRTAGELMAWYDTRPTPPDLGTALTKAVLGLRAGMSGIKPYEDAYTDAKSAYVARETAAATQPSQIPVVPQTGAEGAVGQSYEQPYYTEPSATVQQPNNYYNYYSDYYSYNGYYPYDYYGYGYQWWWPSGYFYGSSFWPWSFVFVNHRHDHRHGDFDRDFFSNNWRHGNWSHGDWRSSGNGAGHHNGAVAAATPRGSIRGSLLVPSGRTLSNRAAIGGEHRPAIGAAGPRGATGAIGTAGPGRTGTFRQGLTADNLHGRSSFSPLFVPRSNGITPSVGTPGRSVIGRSTATPLAIAPQLRSTPQAFSPQLRATPRAAPTPRAVSPQLRATPRAAPTPRAVSPQLRATPRAVPTPRAASPQLRATPRAAPTFRAPTGGRSFGGMGFGRSFGATGGGHSFGGKVGGHR